jgi:hypothetical protein
MMKSMKKVMISIKFLPKIEVGPPRMVRISFGPRVYPAHYNGTFQMVRENSL